MEKLLLQANSVSKSFAGVPALKNGALSVYAGRVHALCGGNGAGKSTFINVISGQIRRDGGEVLLSGLSVDFHVPAQALAAGIAVITQELSPVLDMTVAENLYLGREPMNCVGLVVNYRRMRQEASELFQRLGFPIDASARMRDLTLAQRQLVEIAKAISRNGQILIMDEPTSAIGEAETEILFRTIRQLTSQGVGIVYVSHRLTEIFTIADDYTVFRDGEWVESGLIKDIDRAHLVRTIVGREVTRTSVGTCDEKPLMLEAKGFSLPGKYEDINVRVGHGEILGLYGLIGAGRTEFVNALFGLDPALHGELTIDGKALHIRHPKEALAQGIALLTEDRKDSGIIGVRPVRENITLASLKECTPAGRISRKREQSAVKRMVDRFHIRLASPEQDVQNLSGGNQQKVLFARNLLTKPRVLLCDEPTRGIDEGTKQQIYQFLMDFVAEGNCAIVVSSELDEILQVSDRIMVFRRGRIAGELTRQEASQEALTHLAS